MKSFIIEGIKANKKGIITKALIVGGLVGGSILAVKLLQPKTDEVEEYTEFVEADAKVNEENINQTEE